MENVLALASGYILKREDNRAAVPREPNDRLLDALVHVAFASWSNSWENKGSNGLVRWIVVAHDIRTGARIHHGATKNPWPMEEILADIRRVVSDAGAPAWVAVPSKRGGVAALLHVIGTPVTRGLDPRNRAVGILIPEMARKSQRQSQDAIRAGLLCPEQRAALRKAEPVAQGPTTEKHFWWPECLDASGMHTNKMVFAADASLDLQGAGGLGVVSNRGDVGIRSWHSDTTIGQMEFEAVILALEMLCGASTHHAMVLSDSKDALKMARMLAAKLMPKPGYCGISDDARARFLQAWSSVEAKVEFEYVRGHVGHPLNEAADELANLARLAAKQPQHLVEDEFWRRVDAVRADLRGADGYLQLAGRR